MRDTSAGTSAATIETITGVNFMEIARSGLSAWAVATLDPTLVHWPRVLVPIDVQAYVAPLGGTGEPVVPLTGGASDRGIPSFAPGAPLAAGVHLHWAMPDALLAARSVSRADGAPAPTLRLPRLPDRWVVVRTLQPVGARTVATRGWVIDAANGSVLDLPSFSGTTAPLPAGQARMSPLDGSSGGSLHWTASYAASAGRFAFHDRLTDLAGSDGVVPTGRWHADQAVYTVAGWWADPAHDPVAPAGGPFDRYGRLAELGWFDGGDAAADLAALLALVGTGATTPDFESRVATLLHGNVLGVPVTGALPHYDDRPVPSELAVGVGHDLDDVVAALGAGVLGLPPESRASAEHLVAAFTGGMIERLGSVDGLEDLAEHEHADMFWALPGTPVAGARPDRLRAADAALVGPTTVGRKGRAAQLGVGLEWSHGGDPNAPASAHTGFPPEPEADGYEKPPRVEHRSAPRFFRPQAPIVALRGARPSHRHHGDGNYEEDGRLRVRYAADCVSEYTGVVTGADVLSTFHSGAIPDEVLLLVREAVLINPYGWQWLAAAANPAAGSPANVGGRLEAEMVRLYGVDGRYDGTSHLTGGGSVSTWADVSVQLATTDHQVAAELAKHSLLKGTPPSPVAVTTWRQPWVPLWLEWRVRVDGRDNADGWEIDGVDLRPVAPTGERVTRTIAGLSPINQGAASALHYAIYRWLGAESQRPSSDLPASDVDLLVRLGDLLGPDSGAGVDLDLVSASLDGIREQLLGIDYVGGVVRAAGANPPAPGKPVPLFAGVLYLEELRLIDAFGRILAVPPAAVSATVTTTELTAGPAPAPALTAGPPPAGHRGMLMRPRIQHHARWLLRLVSPAPSAGAPPEAYVDQIEPQTAVNPVSGFLLPDHMDEELEVFTVDGTAIGELGHDSVSGTVTWEPAPGRAVPADAAPHVAIEPAAGIVADIATGLLLADAQARARGIPPAASALSALLRAIDTTLWSVDTFGAIGSATVAGLIGRPVAVVRALLTLDAPNDLSEVDVRPPATVAEREAAFAGLTERRFAVRLGTASRSDDALLGFYVDDDYTRLHLVDKAIAEYAVDSGRHRGHLGPLGAVTVPDVQPLTHPYVVPEPTLWVRPGQTVRLTLLMLPAGRVHVTSGILPRKQIALAEDWVAPGLRRLVPSVRVGPVLVDPAEIRLPLISVLGERQTFTRRTGPLTWRDDPIVAATQSAYLPRLAHEAQEGWVRVTPEKPEAQP